MGLADAAVMQGIVYGSSEFHEYCERIGGVLATGALLATSQIVGDVGKSPFPDSFLVEQLFDLFRSHVEGGELFKEGVLFSDEWFLGLS